MSIQSTADVALVSEGFNRLAQAEASPKPYGLLAFARDLDAERRRLDDEALAAAHQTLQAEEAGE